MKRYNVAILGATGAVGEQMIRVLWERRFPIGGLRLLSSERSAGGRMAMFQISLSAGAEMELACTPWIGNVGRIAQVHGRICQFGLKASSVPAMAQAMAVSGARKRAARGISLHRARPNAQKTKNDNVLKIVNCNAVRTLRARSAAINA